MIQRLKFYKKDIGEFETFYIKSLIKSLDSEYIIKFFNENNEICDKLNIKPYEIIDKCSEEKQKKVAEKLSKLKLSDIEKRKILVVLNDNVKEKLNTEGLSEEEIKVLNLKTYDEKEKIEKRGKICLEFEKDPDIYKGLEELIYINPTELSKEEKEKLVELCEENPDFLITDNIDLSKSTAKEYVEAEKWIKSILQEIDPNWSNIQKLAYIDNAVGKKISYSPDFDSEVSNVGDARALWKIIATGKGVCNGISQVEKYILESVGIESEIIGGKNHAFLKIKNIEIPTEEGVKTGDTIVDPTWNLADQRYGAKPSNFCLSYEEIRKHDINSKGNDKECHRNDEKLESATLNMDEKYLREVYKSIGLTNEDGTFPIRDFMNKLDKCSSLGIKGVEEKLKLLKEYYPNFSSSISSTMDILNGTVIKPEELNLNRCIINRVYQKDDENRETKMYIYAKSEKDEEVFYVVGENDQDFTKMCKEDFIEKYECYENDLDAKDGKRPWEIENDTKEEKRLELSEKKKVASNKIDLEER